MSVYNVLCVFQVLSNSSSLMYLRTACPQSFFSGVEIQYFLQISLPTLHRTAEMGLDTNMLPATSPIIAALPSCLLVVVYRWVQQFFHRFLFLLTSINLEQTSITTCQRTAGSFSKVLRKINNWETLLAYYLHEFAPTA